MFLFEPFTVTVISFPSWVPLMTIELESIFPFNFEIEMDSGAAGGMGGVGAAGGMGGVGAPGAPAGGGGGGMSRVDTENTFLPVLGSEKVVESGRIVTMYCIAIPFLCFGFWEFN